MRTRLGVGIGILVVLLAGLAAWAIHSPFGQGGPSPVLFRVEEGATLRRVALDLEEAGLVRDATVFQLWARLRGEERLVRSGDYELAPRASTAAVLASLVSGPLATAAVTLPEGWTRRQTVEGLASALEMDPAPLDSLTAGPVPGWAEALSLPEGASLEGYLFPETYRFARGISARRVVGTLVDAFVEAWPDSFSARADSVRMSRHEVVTLASIVEAEAVFDAERPAVAAVYLNRIAAGWKLEADPTVAYALDKIGERLSFRDLEVDSPYNTYRYAGLPPGPINSPGTASIRAVLWPRPDFDAMYFVADGKGGHRFSRTWEEHQAAVRAYRVIQRERRGGASSGGG